MKKEFAQKTITTTESAQIETKWPLILTLVTTLLVIYHETTTAGVKQLHQNTDIEGIANTIAKNLTAYIVNKCNSI